MWGDRDGPVTELPTLREVDLYAFQVCSDARKTSMFIVQLAQRSTGSLAQGAFTQQLAGA